MTIGCFNHRLGCVSQRDTNRGTLVKQGKDDAYKLPGTAGSNLGNQMLCQGENKNYDPLEDRQHNNNLVHLQAGGHSIPSAEPVDQRSVALVHGEKYHTESCPPSREAEHHHGRRIASDEGQNRLCPKVFHKINQKLGPLQVDLFASRLTTQLPHCAGWRPDPEAMACDAFSLDWCQMKGYANPHGT